MWDHKVTKHVEHRLKTDSERPLVPGDLGGLLSGGYIYHYSRHRWNVIQKIPPSPLPKKIKGSLYM